jgi:uncharacterized protein (TIGR03435 family)
MTTPRKSEGTFLDRSLQRLGDPQSPTPEQMDSAAARVLQRLRVEAAAASALPASVPLNSTSIRHRRRLWRPVFVIAAAVLSALVLLVVMVRVGPRHEARVVIDAAEGGLYRIDGTHVTAIRPGDRIEEGETIRSTFGKSAVLALADGSRIEMRATSELVVESAKDGVQIGLHNGSVIVSAANQRPGHLYVKTKDCTVSVTGTVFLVQAEDEGSRVAVIQGEVQVLQGTTAKTVLPGQQVTTAASMDSLGVVDEIAWSRDLATHLTQLQQATAATEFRRLGFRTASIIPDPSDSPGHVDSSSPGIVCHGVNGTLKAALGNAESFVPEGTCVGNHVPLGDMIAFAYDLPRQHVLGGPDWLQSRRLTAFQTFQIEARAKDPSATREQLRQMFQTLLADRFHLDVHWERRDFAGHVLAVGKNGPAKLKETSEDEDGPIEIRGKNRLVIKGKTSMNKLADYLSGTEMGLGVVADRTDLTGTYEYTLHLNTSGKSATPGTVLAAVRQELGLTLEPEKIPVDVIVVDRADRPSGN